MKREKGRTRGLFYFFVLVSSLLLLCVFLFLCCLQLCMLFCFVNVVSLVYVDFYHASRRGSRRLWPVINMPRDLFNW